MSIAVNDVLAEAWLLFVSAHSKGEETGGGIVNKSPDGNILSLTTIVLSWNGCSTLPTFALSLALAPVQETDVQKKNNTR
mmetsp:Transcript_25642/g.40721  ORF Transcript_25642/g.40721 Transcript_25642/m.40721 type:complete len:80 (-) Transcript_25642:45-284(-)